VSADPVLDAIALAWAPDPILTVSEWADQHRMLSSKSASEPGPWRTSRVPYLREIMDALSSGSPVRKIVFMKGSQIGATECGNNWIGYAMQHSPGPMMLIEPTLDTCKKISQERIAPMIAEAPALAAIVSEPRSRTSGNTLLRKDFPGGVLYMAGANSGAGLRMVPVGKLFADEIDEYPGDVNNQGSPLELAVRRTSNFPRRKIYFASTPTVRGLSNIEKEFRRTDQRRYFVPCPECAHMDYLTWDGRDWFEASAGIHFRVEWEPDQPDTARLVCPACAARVPESAKRGMLAAGAWRSTVECDEPGLRGYHLSGLYSPWQSWGESARLFLHAKANPGDLKVWVNTTLGESWEERGTRVDADVLMARREPPLLKTYGDEQAEVPAGVGILVASVDVQADRLEALVLGYGAGEECWVIAHSQFAGDPGRVDASPGERTVWMDLDRFLVDQFLHESGQRVSIACVVIDARYHTNEVYRFCSARSHRRLTWKEGPPATQLVFPVMGTSVDGREIVLKPSVKNRYGVKVFPLGTDAAKDTIYSRLRIAGPGPGFYHLPHWVDKEFVDQLTAEKAIRKWIPRKGWTRVWEKVRDRNEVLDLAVYGLASLGIMGSGLVRSLAERAAKWAAPASSPAAGAPESPQAAAALEGEGVAPSGPPRRPRKGWLDSWR
jgi:phage terminase large subunit GpA-like protein